MASSETPDILVDEGLYLNLWNVGLFVSLAAIFLIVFRYLLWRRKYSQLMPGRKVRFFSILGNLSDIPLRTRDRNGYTMNVFLLQLFEAYSKILKEAPLFCFWFFCSPIVILSKTKAIQDFANETKMVDKGWLYDWTRPILGSGLVTSNAKKWKSRRKLLNPCVGMDILKKFIPAMNEHSRLLVRRWKREIHKAYTDISLDLSLCAFDVLSDTMLGINCGAQADEDEKFSHIIHCVHRGMELITERVWNVFLWSDWIYSFTKSGSEMKKIVEISENLTRTIIKETKERYLTGQLKIGDGKRKSLIEVLIEQHLQTRELNEEDIREEVITFTVAGHHSTAISMTWTLYLIGLHRDVQCKLHKELDGIFGEDQERPATNEDLKEMQYLECVIKESLRLYPSVYFYARHVSEDIKICDYTIPKNSTCLLMPYLVQRDGKAFTNPERFDPDRFRPENSASRNPYSFITFGVGPRNCIGQVFALMEEKIVLSTLLRSYTFDSLEQRDRMVPTIDAVMKPSNSVKIRIRPRTKM